MLVVAALSPSLICFAAVLLGYVLPSAYGLMPITYPNMSSVWYRDYAHNVTWDMNGLPPNAQHPFIKLSKSESDTFLILAKDFDLTTGRVEIQVPWVDDGKDYQLKIYMQYSDALTLQSNTTNATGTSTGNAVSSTILSSTQFRIAQKVIDNTDKPQQQGM